MPERFDPALRAAIEAIPGDPDLTGDVAAEVRSQIPSDEQRRNSKLSQNAADRRPRPLDPDINPWDRQPRETVMAYEAFCAYRDSEHRNVSRLIAGGMTGHARVWSSRWSWPARALSWDRFLTAKDLEDSIRWRRTMNNRQRKAAALAQSKIITWLQQLEPSMLTPTEAARWFEVAVKVERLASGGETSKVEVGGDLRIENMSAEDVAIALSRLQTEIGKVIDMNTEEPVPE